MAFSSRRIILPERVLGGVAGTLTDNIPDRQLELWEGNWKDALAGARLGDFLISLFGGNAIQLYRPRLQAH